MLRINGYIGDEVFDNKDIKAFDLLDKMGLNEYFKPLIEQFSHIEVSLKNKRVDAFNQPITPSSFIIPASQMWKGRTKNDKDADFQITYYEGTRKSRDARTNIVTDEFIPFKLHLGANNVFSRQYEGLKDFDKMVILLFESRIASPLNNSNNKENRIHASQSQAHHT